MPLKRLCRSIGRQSLPRLHSQPEAGNEATGQSAVGAQQCCTPTMWFVVYAIEKRCKYKPTAKAASLSNWEN